MLIAAAAIGTTTLAAQTPADSTLRRQQRTLDSLIAVIRSLQQRIDSLTRGRAPGDTAVPDELAALRAAAAAATADSATVAARPQQARLGQNALNPEISATGDFRASAVHPGPQTQSFEAREFEIGLQSALDPYSVTKIFLSLENGEIDVEEGYVYYTGLPGHFRLDLGKFRQPLGELNRWHLHALPEGEYPLVSRLYTGGEEGLAATGASLYWPLPFSGRAGTFELTTQLTKGTNPGLFLSGNRPAALAQLSGFWQFSRSTFAMLSVSGAAGSNPDSTLRSSRLGVLAARLSWRPPAEAQFKEFTIRGEWWALHRDFDSLTAEPTRYGGFVGATWKLNRRWTAGLRYDYVQSPVPTVNQHAVEISPTLTWWQSEFVYLRGQFTHSRDITGTTNDRFTLQAVWAMGPHKHELF